MSEEHPLIKKFPGIQGTAGPWTELIELPDGTLVKEFRLFDVQREVLAADKQIVALVAGSGIGKTVVSGAWLLQEISRNPQGTFIILAPTIPILNSATRPTFQEAIRGTVFDCEYKRNDKEFRLPTGGIVYCRSVDDPNSFHGIHADAVVCDEAGLYGLEAWHTIQQRTNAKRGRIFIGSTPYAKHEWLKTLVIDKAAEGHPDFYVRTACSLENPYYDRKKFQFMYETLPTHRFKMMYLAEWCGVSGLVYPEFSRCHDLEFSKSINPLGKKVAPEDLEILPAGEFVMGIDWGGGTATADPFCALLGVHTEEDEFHVFWERYVTNASNKENFEVIKDLDATLIETFGHGISRCFADASRPSSIKDFTQETGITCRKAANNHGSIATGIDRITSRIRTGRLFVHKDACPGLVKESGLYSYPTDEAGEAYGVNPIDKHGHAFDALRYAVETLR